MTKNKNKRWKTITLSKRTVSKAIFDYLCGHPNIKDINVKKGVKVDVNGCELDNTDSLNFRVNVS